MSEALFRLWLGSLLPSYPFVYSLFVPSPFPNFWPLFVYYEWISGLLVSCRIAMAKGDRRAEENSNEVMDLEL